MNVFSKRENKTTRVALYPGVSFPDSSRATPACPFSKCKAHNIQYKYNNDKYIKNLSNVDLTDTDKAFLCLFPVWTISGNEINKFVELNSQTTSTQQ